MDVKKVLEAAIETGELITIVYSGGSRPNSTRMILPKEIKEDVVLAYCFNAKGNRHFVYEKITIIDNPDGLVATTYNQTPPIKNETQPSKDVYEQMPEPSDLITRITPYVDELNAIKNYHLKITETSVILYRVLKNGKPSKSPYLSLEWFNNSKRPWQVYGSHQSATFTLLAHAVEQFMNRVHSDADIPNATGTGEKITFPLAGQRWVVTGKLSMSRNEITTLLEDLGATVSDSVTIHTTCLLIGEKAGSKLNKAKQLGIPIMDEATFLDRDFVIS